MSSEFLDIPSSWVATSHDPTPTEWDKREHEQDRESTTEDIEQYIRMESSETQNELHMSRYEIIQVRQLLIAMRLVGTMSLHNESNVAQGKIEKGSPSEPKLSYRSKKPQKASTEAKLRQNSLECFKRILHSACIELKYELKALEDLFLLVEESEDTIAASKALRTALDSYLEEMGKIVDAVNMDSKMEGEANWPVGLISLPLDNFHRSLHRKKHTFWFREVKRWEERLKRQPSEAPESSSLSLKEIASIIMEHLDATKIDLVTEELKSFAEKVLPSLVTNEDEKATMRYINMTAVATFFSSVTATTLQFSFQRTESELGGIVNLFWFLSLVFSVSSGVNGLLGTIWRKSSIFDKCTPPKPIKMWLMHAPIVFLVIAASSFVIGLSLFAFLSSLVHYVSIATNVFAVLHLLGISIVLLWFMLAERPVTGKVVDSLKSGYSYLAALRNIYWALTLDDKVAHLNLESLSHEPTSYYHPPPFILSTIRNIILPFKNLLQPKKRSNAQAALRRLLFALRERLCCIRHCPDEEANPDRNEESSFPPESRSTEVSKELFKAHLASVFQHTRYVETIMREVELWETRKIKYIKNEGIITRLEILLWGYPELVQKFKDEVYPVLLTAKESNERRMENPPPDHRSNIRSAFRELPDSTGNRKPSLIIPSLPSPPPPHSSKRIGTESEDLLFKYYHVTDRIAPTENRGGTHSQGRRQSTSSINLNTSLLYRDQAADGSLDVSHHTTEEDNIQYYAESILGPLGSSEQADSDRPKTSTEQEAPGLYEE